ncbi:MAG: hypothetical protein V3V08_25025 [Nannocystaceae bacterium]
MSYYRSAFTSFEEFQREALAEPPHLGKDELELLEAIDAADNFDQRADGRANWWE